MSTQFEKTVVTVLGHLVRNHSFHNFEAKEESEALVAQLQKEHDSQEQEERAVQDAKAAEAAKAEDDARLQASFQRWQESQKSPTPVASTPAFQEAPATDSPNNG